MLQIIKKLLLGIIDNIDSGNSNMTDEEALHAVHLLKEVYRRDMPINKYQACQYLNMSRAKFDNLVREGKLPKGKKIAGWRELAWFKRDLKK